MLSPGYTGNSRTTAKVLSPKYWRVSEARDSCFRPLSLRDPEEYPKSFPQTPLRLKVFEAKKWAMYCNLRWMAGPHTYDIRTCMHTCIHTYIPTYIHTYTHKAHTSVYLCSWFVQVKSPKVVSCLGRCWELWSPRSFATSAAPASQSSTWSGECALRRSSNKHRFDSSVKCYCYDNCDAWPGSCYL